METGIDRLMLALILTDITLLATSRIKTAIRLAALQGVLLGLLAVLAPPGAHSGRALFLAMVGFGVRGLLFPWLLLKAKRHAGVREEVDPLVGQAASVLFGIAMLGGAMSLGQRLSLHGPTASGLVVPAALFTIFAGVFLVIARRKALTQVLGYLVLENGIYAFGVAAVGEVPALVELGALLDLFVAVLVMSIAMYRLTEAFDHMDTDQLTSLRG
jgi:hydrogenase-4 component E